MKKTIFLTILATLFVNAETVDTFYQLKPKTLNNNECKSGKKATLCLHKSLTYPTADVLTDGLRESLILYINNAKLAYKKETLKGYLEDVDLDKDDYIIGDYESLETLELFDYNKPIMTLSKSGYQFAGGAHGNREVSFINYDIKSKKELELKDIVDANNSKFLKIAQQEYKKSEKLLPNQNLGDAGWFENRFVLSDNIAITSKGLLFHYNPYEIKSHAFGMTEFLLPYSKIEPFIESKVVKNFKNLAETKKLKIEKSSDNEKVTFTIQKEKDDFYKVDIDTSFYGEVKRRWFSLSFPNFKNSNDIKILKSSNTQNFKLYDIGSKLFSKETKKTIKSSYPLLEAESKNNYFTLSFKVKKPKSMPYFCVNYRVTTKTKSLFDADYLANKDQQGFVVERVCLD